MLVLESDYNGKATTGQQQGFRERCQYVTGLLFL